MAPISALLATWFTPSSLFIVVNIVIGTNAVTSRFASPNNKQNHHPEQPPHLVRSPSLLQRVRSFRLTYNNHDSALPLSETVTECTHPQPQLVRTPSLLERVRSFNLGLHKNETPEAETEYNEVHEPEPEGPKEPRLVRTPSLLQRLQSINLSRIYSSETVHVDQEPEPEVPDSKPGRGSGVNVAEMRNSANEREREVRCEWEEDEETVEKRRPETARCETTTSFREDEEVDAKADDFINRFKKQLRLQRVDSLLRYREMIRGNT